MMIARRTRRFLLAHEILLGRYKDSKSIVHKQNDRNITISKDRYGFGAQEIITDSFVSYRSNSDLSNRCCRHSSGSEFFMSLWDALLFLILITYSFFQLGFGALLCERDEGGRGWRGQEEKIDDEDPDTDGKE